MNHLLPLLFLLSAFSLAPRVLSDDSHYLECIPRRCQANGTDISYPFWISDQHPSYCGHPSFQISCKDDRPILSISDKNFTAKSIFYSNSSLLLVDDVAYESSCGAPLSNFSLDGTPFSLVSGSHDLYFFYNCTLEPSYDYIYDVKCYTDPSLHSFAYFYDDVAYFTNSSGYSYTGGYSSGGYSSGSYSSGSNTCQSVISAPVDVSPTTNISTLAKLGFLMNWSVDNCTACAGSGGRCGYDGSDKLVCFCPSGVRATTCGNGRKLGTKIAVGVGTGTGFMAMMSIVFFVVYTRHRKKYAQTSVVSRSISSMFSSQTDFGKGSFSYGVPIFDYEELEKATNHFDCAAELGNGGFGKVYKGKLRDGRVVAVKRLYEQNYRGVEQFMNEVDILARLRHPNLISLFGVVLIELISSLPAVDIMRRRQEINLSALAINKMQANALHELVDANLGFQSDDRTREMITAVAELAFRCLQPQHDDRPSMQEVLRTLKQIQKLGQGNVKAEEGDDPSDDSALLKDDSRSFSPDSVTGKWDSMSSSSVTHTASAQLSSR
ncbi:hypothetical protein MLD38_024010 [Melastoma candidum]|uniref:Uncharacterized protein n=1 Tax=Melastoma candidum TaxID=119954 RepID=A0ACB9NRV4_9MYRT|nr:hypothetical protein MLD38_024010 [Melastoma candidum]